MYLVNRDLHYIRGQDWRYSNLDEVAARLDAIINGNLTGNWYDASADGHQDRQTDDECQNCGRTDYAFRVPISPTDDERTNERTEEQIASWYVIPSPTESSTPEAN